MRRRLLLVLTLGVVVGLLCGCGEGADALPPEPDLQPIVGKVTVQGKPLANAVISFLQVDERGTLAVGETDDEGNYQLEHMGRHGAAAAEYMVGISYLVGTDGTIYGLAARSGLAKPYGFFSAKELIAPQWSDLGQATHRATVPPGGGTLNFDIQEPLLPPPDPPAPAPAEPTTTVPEAVSGNPVGESIPQPTEPADSPRP
jgi:hypothetical protein